MKRIAVLIVVAVAVGAGCRSSSPTLAAGREVQIPRVRLPRVQTTPEIRAEVAGLIDTLKSRSEVIYKDDPDGMQSMSINQLVEIGQPALLQLVDEYYAAFERYEYKHFRYIVVAILYRMQEPMSQRFLVWVLNRGDAKERRLAAEALWRFGDAEYVPALITALDDDSLEVVNTAAAALRAITGREFSLHRNVTPEQREMAIKRWRQWWMLMGYVLLRGRADDSSR